MVAAARNDAPQMMMAALAYAKRFGWRVIPLHHVIVGADTTARCSCKNFKTCGKSTGKHPRFDAWQTLATSDPATIEGMWGPNQSAGIGVATGVESGFFVVDLDDGGQATLDELEERHGKLPSTVEAITGSGGRHLLFKHPGGGVVPNRVKLLPGLDVRGDGGLIAVAPTLHLSGRRYAWEASSRPGELDIAEAPSWLIELIRSPPTRKGLAGVAEGADLPDLNSRMDRARKYLAHIPGAVSGKGGHQQTFVAAMALVRGFALPEHAALELLAAEYNQRCEPRWSVAELEHKVSSAATEGARPLGYLLVDRTSATPAAAAVGDGPSARAVDDAAEVLPDLDGYVDDERASIADEARSSESPFRWISTAEVFAPLPPTKWLVPGLQICPGRLAMTAAYGASGKTLALQALALAFAAGKRAWGEFQTGRGGIVCHVDHEQGRHATLKRYQRLALGHGIQRDEIEDRLRVSVFPPVHLNQPGAESAYAREFEGVELVIVDALRGATPGSDENDSKIRECLDVLSRVSEKIGACFWVIHHAGKPKEGHSDARTVARGSSAIFDACGAVYVMAGEKGEPKLVSQQKTPAEAEGSAVDDFYLAIEDVGRAENPAEGVRVVYQTKEQVSPPKRPGDAFEQKVERVYEAIRSNGGVHGAARLTELLGIRRSTVHEAVAALIERGRVVNTGTSTRPQLHVKEASQ